MIWIYAAAFAAQVAMLGTAWLILRRVRQVAARAGLAAANAIRAMEWAEKAAACVPFPRRTHVDD